MSNKRQELHSMIDALHEVDFEQVHAILDDILAYRKFIETGKVNETQWEFKWQAAKWDEPIMSPEFPIVPDDL